MVAEELRCGNLVEFEGEILPILSIDSKNKFTRDFRDYTGSVTLPKLIGTEREYITDQGVWIAKLKEIPITKEWLIRLGFILEEDLGDEKYYQKGNYGVKVSEGEDYFYFYMGKSAYSVLKEIECVHRLQNIYFEHTDEELKEIK